MARIHDKEKYKRNKISKTNTRRRKMQKMWILRKYIVSESRDCVLHTARVCV